MNLSARERKTGVHVQSFSHGNIGSIPDAKQNDVRETIAFSQ